MLALESFGLGNFRAFPSTGLIELRPLTLVVGKNSSGKSSLLRFWPLLRQSVETRTSSPFLWYGPYVDFGSFPQTVRLGASTIEASFSFKTVSDDATPYRNRRSGVFTNPGDRISVKIAIDKTDEKSWHQTITVKAHDLAAEIELDTSGRVARLFINDLPIPGLTEASFPELVAYAPYFIPTFRELVYTKSETAKDSTAHKRRTLPPLVYVPYIRNSFVSGGPPARMPTIEHELHRALRAIAGNRIGADRITYIGQELRLADPTNFVKQSKQLQGGETWQKRLASRQSREQVSTVRKLHFALSLPSLLFQADEAIAQFSSSVQYIGPLRATAERYYRRQQLAINEIDHRGENVPILLDSLNSDQRRQLKQWSQEQLGFEVRVKSSGGHVWLEVSDQDNRGWINLADAGFGFSQILPVALSLWRTESRIQAPGRRTRNSASIVAIEQPELHLHPGMQAKLGSVLARIAGLGKGQEGHPKYFVETHSEALVNAIGNAIREKILEPSDVQILLVERGNADEGGPNATIRTAGVDEEGFLTNWPYGFLAPVPYT